MTDAEFVEFGESYLATTQRYRTDKPHFIDKMPNNFASLGFLKLILPNATVINAKRHPLDCCISCFKQLFYKGPMATGAGKSIPLKSHQKGWAVFDPGTFGDKAVRMVCKKKYDM